MTSLTLRATTALSPLLLIAPAAGQNSQQPVIITPPMRDFNLPPSGQTPTPRPAATPTPAPVIRPVPIVQPTPTAVPSPRPTAPRPAPAARPSAIIAPQPTPTVIATPTGIATPLTPAASPQPGNPPVQSELTPDIAANPDSGGDLPGWLWPTLGALLLLAAGGTAGWWFGRRRRRDEADEVEPVAPPPPADPSPGPPPLSRQAPPASPRATPASPPVPPPAGPLLTEMRPLRAAIRDGIVTVDFELFIQNRGTDAADNIRATLTLLGANADQDQQIASFHAAARMAAGSEPFSLAAGGVYMLSGQVSLPGEQMAVVNVQGKPMFVPIVPVALRWYAGLSIRTLRDVFMVGTAPAPGSDKLGPLWVERAGEGFGRLAAKRYVPKV